MVWNLFETSGKGGFLIWSLLFLFVFFMYTMASEWSINGGIQYLNGDYIYTTSTSTYYFTGGIRYQANRWNIGISLPAIVQNNNLVSGTGRMFLPSHLGDNGDGGGMGSEHHGGGMIDGRWLTDDVESQYEAGWGDVYLSGQYQLLTEKNSRPSVTLTPQVKLPTASTSKSFGTGEFDAGVSLNLSKRLENYAGFLDAGYWMLGDSPEIDYRNPFTYGIGVGRFFRGGTFSALLYYQGYTTILPAFDSPRQALLGLYYRAGSQTIVSLTTSAGLSNTSPDFGLALGVNRTL